MAKKVFLIGFSAPILIEVAKNLKQKGIKIVYWHGRGERFNALTKDKGIFSNTIFHNSYDGIKNIPPISVDISNFEPLSKDIIEKMYPYESQALSMIGRADYANSPLTRKRNIYYQYIEFWQGMLKKFQPDAVLFYSVPHNGLSYSLYALAKILDIKTIMLNEININNRTLLLDDYQTDYLKLLKYVQNNYKKPCRFSGLSADWQEYYLKQISKHIDSTPTYLKRALNRKAPLRTPTPKAVIKNIVNFNFFAASRNYLKMLFTKIREGSFDEDLLGISYKLLMKKRERINKSSKNEYDELQVKPNLTKKFIYIPLNLQPERTTCPQGGIFDDQILMIKIVASCLPDDWIIYIKESPLQWLAANIGSYLYRYPGYYGQISKMKNTYLVPIETSTYDLINQSQAVAIATSTAGWEAILRSKPVLVFGYVWYMYCHGVFRVSDSASCQQALSEITRGFKPDQEQVLNYLAALDKNSIKAKYFRTLYREKMNFNKDDYVSVEDNVNNLTAAFYQAICK